MGNRTSARSARGGSRGLRRPGQGRLRTHHWDQASLPVQIGLLDRSIGPVTGAENPNGRSMCESGLKIRYHAELYQYQRMEG